MPADALHRDAERFFHRARRLSAIAGHAVEQGLVQGVVLLHWEASFFQSFLNSRALQNSMPSSSI